MTPALSKGSTAADPVSDRSAATVPPASSAPLCIYSLVDMDKGLEDWATTLPRVRAMGFTHVLVSPAALTTKYWEGPGDVDATALSASASGLTLLRSAVGACTEHGLQLLLDVDVTRVASDTSLRAQHPDWFRAILSPEDLPDPRRQPAETGLRWNLGNSHAAQAAAAFWNCHLLEWVHEGVSGFRLESLDAAPAAWWKALCAGVHTDAVNTRMLAWTQGLKPQAVAALAGVGFDHSFCSAEWWDYRSPWLATEFDHLAAVAPPLSCAGAPASISSRPDRAECAHQRAVWLAATLGSGWLMPAGFEYGANGPVQNSSDRSTHAPKQATPVAQAFDLTSEITAANAFVANNHDAAIALPTLHVGVGWVGLLRASADHAQLLLINANLERPTVASLSTVARGEASAFALWRDASGDEFSGTCKLAPGRALRLEAARAAPVVSSQASPALLKALNSATQAPRIAIEAVKPCVDAGRFPVKCVVGDSISVEADVFMDGHDVLAVALYWRACDEEKWHQQRMLPLGNDRFEANFVPLRMGRHEYAVHAWRDAYASYRHELTVKHDAGVPIALELEEGRQLLELTLADTPPARAQLLRAVMAELAGADNDDERYQRLIAAKTGAAMAQADPRPFEVQSAVLPLEVDRRAAHFASWYELFPRSQTEDPARHGTFRDVIGRLPAIRDMGFDVLYFPPIHPIGDAFRKGRNNTLSPTPDDPGSPYAIGSAEGGHTAVHAQLGTIDDFRALRDAALEQGLELALDFAIQCSPDHPWLKEHPEWFDWRPDGSLRYAENPPKKYQDIVNVDFYADGAVPSLWQALCDVVLYWAGEGVRTFRVDNPHTKPYPFWEWLIARVRSEYPGALFLAEAFTQPKPMYRLAKAGFSQSYTYFTWRHTKEEFTAYLTELSQGPAKDFFRPNFFVNTPDINPQFLQRSGRAGFLMRAALAATLSGLWGMYSGFELCEAAALPGREEYLDSEKYQIKPRDWNAPANIVAEISQLNAIRRVQPALQSHLGVRFLRADDPQVLFFERFVKHGGDDSLPLDRVLVAIMLDPFADRDTVLHLPLGDWGFGDDAQFQAQDLLHDVTAIWRGPQQQVWLGRGMPYAIWHLQETL